MCNEDKWAPQTETKNKNKNKKNTRNHFEEKNTSQINKNDSIFIGYYRQGSETISQVYRNALKHTTEIDYNNSI